MPLTLHLISDVHDHNPVSEVHLLPRELRREVTIPVEIELLPVATEIFTLSLSYSGNEKVLLVNTEANVTILDGMSIQFQSHMLVVKAYTSVFVIHIYIAFEVGFENSSYTVSEDVGTVTLTITATIPNPEPNPVSFRVRTLGGTAQCNS